MDLKRDFGAAGRRGSAVRVAVIGGGASGVLMALQLLRHGPGVRVVLVEKTDRPGRGVAYATRDPAHLLNTRVSSMSAYADAPDHFLDWLRTRLDPTASPSAFVARALYGRYLAETLAEAEGRDRLTCLQAEAVRLVPGPGDVAVHLAGGQVLPADHVVLATGHALPQADPGGAVTQPWDGTRPDPDADVLIVGTGLTMVDQVLSLLDAGHRGRIEAVSRRGLLPQPHADAAPLALGDGELPLGQPVSATLRWLRRRVARIEAQGGDWRSVVDGLRPHAQRLWQALDTDARARFLRHACGWWEVHRHRLPPASAARLEAARAEGRLVVRRAAFLGAARGPDGTIAVRLRPPGAGTEQVRRFGHVLDCRGIRRDPGHHAAPVIRRMLAEGLAHLDPLRLGLAVDGRARVLRPDGTPLAGVVALGPVSRAGFWEITAVPDIRQQAARLSSLLLDPAGNSG